jgi:hypothetical protein
MLKTSAECGIIIYMNAHNLRKLLILGLGMSCLACMTAPVESQVPATVSRSVYMLRADTRNPVWDQYMGVQTGAARLYAPTAFERKHGSVTMTMETPGISLRTSSETVVARTDQGTLLRIDVAISGLPALPRADRQISLQFSLVELTGLGPPESESPALHAIMAAIMSGPYEQGQAWIESLSFDGTDFSAIIGLKKTR